MFSKLKNLFSACFSSIANAAHSLLALAGIAIIATVGLSKVHVYVLGYMALCCIVLVYNFGLDSNDGIVDSIFISVVAVVTQNAFWFGLMALSTTVLGAATLSLSYAAFSYVVLNNILYDYFELTLLAGIYL